MTQTVSERPYLSPGLTGHQGWGQIAKFRRSFANPFEATLNRILCFLVSHERRHVHAGDVTLNSLYVLDNIFQAANGFVRRQGFDPGRSLFENASCAPALR